MKPPRKVTLIVKTTIQRNAPDRSAGLLEFASGHEQADAEQIVTGRHPEQTLEYALKLADREIGAPGHVIDRDLFAEMPEHEFKRGSESRVFTGRVSRMIVGT